MKKYVWLVIIAILIGLNDGRVLGFQGSDTIINSTISEENPEQVMIILNNKKEPIIAIRSSVISWIKFVPDNQIIM